MAERREDDHPADAVAVYKGQIDRIVDAKTPEAYQQAAELIGRIGRLMARLGEGAEFSRYVDAVRAAHRPKRNFVAMLERVG